MHSQIKSNNKRHPGTYLFHKHEDDSTVKMYIPEHATLTEQLEAFDRFLRAVGYSFNGELDINGGVEE